MSVTSRSLRIVTDKTPPVNIASVTTDNTVIASANSSRIGIILQNVSTSPCLIGLGVTVSSTSYHYILAADSSALQGNGGTISLDEYQGAINGKTAAGTAVIAVLQTVSST